MKTNGKQILPWVLVAVLALALFRGGPDDGGVTPEPTPTRSVAEEAADVLPKVGQGYAKAFRAAAEKVRSGEIESDRQLVDFLQPQTREARRIAREDFDAAMERAMPDGEIDEPASVASLLREIAEAFGNGR